MKLLKPALSLAVVLATFSPVDASLTPSFQFNGNGNWSIDGGSANGNISAIVPVGSTVEKAFLYSSTFSSSSSRFPSVTLNSAVVSGASWTALGVTGGASSLQAYRADVTSLVSSFVSGGSVSTFNFTVSSEFPASTIDGEVLAIIYSNPAESLRTIAFLDGFSDTRGDGTSVNLASPLTAAQLAAPDFQATLSLGIGFGFQPFQDSLVDVNGRRLTSSAGGHDDGFGSNGGLITVGGIGDSPSNPLQPNAPSLNTVSDDELYTLTPFLTPGSRVININTVNPSNDDNLFFAGINLTAVADVTTSVPDGGSSALLLSLSLFGLAWFSRQFDDVDPGHQPPYRSSIRVA